MRIPAGRAERLAAARAGQRQCRHLGAPAGDLYITTRVEEHPFFHRDGDNIEIQVPVTVSEAGLGAKIEVPTIDGRTLLKIPPGTQNGQKFRLREKGVFNARKNQRGDQIVEVVIQAPKVQDERTKELLRELAQAASRRSARGNLGEGVIMAKATIQSRVHDLVGGRAVRDPSANAAPLRARRTAASPPAATATRGSTPTSDLERLEVILHLTRDLGVNLAGVEIILNMREKMSEMQRQIEEFVSTPQSASWPPARAPPGRTKGTR